MVGAIRTLCLGSMRPEGRDQGKLVPVLLDTVKPPMGFRQFQTIDCSRSNRIPSGSSLQQILDAINKAGGALQTRSPAPAPVPVSRRPWFSSGRISRPASLAIAALALAVATLIAWNVREQQTSSGGRHRPS